jgi:hypothetical protein
MAQAEAGEGAHRALHFIARAFYKDELMLSKV